MRYSRRRRVIGAAAVLSLMSGLAVVTRVGPLGASDTDCARRYVAGGDAVANGMEAEESQDQASETKRYSRQLLEDHLHDSPGPWCEYNTSKDPTTTDTYPSEIVFEGLSQQAAAWEREPRLITLTLGRQNSTIVDHVEKCFQNVKDHDFLDANACALNVLGNTAHWDELKKDLAVILNTYMIQQDGSPELIVAVTGYFNPFPSATDVATKIPSFCATLVDTIATCIARWVLLPPALITLDQVVQKMNTTIEEVVKEYHHTSQGRFVFVNPYEKFKSHCMRMKVKITTRVYHPTNDVHTHEHSDYVNFGCDESKTWIAKDGVDGRKSPFLYLTPAATGVLIFADQTTTEMGIYPNEKGHDCIADLVFEAVWQKLDITKKPAEACADD